MKEKQQKSDEQIIDDVLTATSKANERGLNSKFILVGRLGLKQNHLKIIQERIIGEGLVTISGFGDGHFFLTAKGKEIINNGGYMNLVNLKMNLEKRRNEQEEIQFEKLKREYRLIKIQQRIWWLPYLISMLSLLVALLALFKGKS